MDKIHRIKKSQDFEKIIHQRKSVANRVFVLYYLPNDEHLKVGLSVSKRLGKAHVRNKVKRQVRMMAHDLFPNDMKCNYIIIVRQQFLKNNFETNKKELNYLFQKSIKRMEKVNGTR